MSEDNRPERRGLTAITIENFKGIGAPVTVPLRPLTLLFGANSAGKSTIIQALQYAWEVLENRNPDVDRTRLGGEVIDLGGFKNLVHKHDLSRSISITLEYRGRLHDESYMFPDMYMSRFHEEELVYQHSAGVTDWVDVETFAVRVTTAWDERTNKAFVAAYEVSLNGNLFGRIEDVFVTREDKVERKGSLLINADHPFLSEEALSTYDNYGDAIMRAIFENFATPREFIIRSFHRMTSAEREEFLKELGAGDLLDSPVSDAPATHSLETPYSGFLVDSVIPEWGKFLSITKMGRGSTDERAHTEEEVIWVLSQLMLGTGEAIQGELSGLRYLGPLREVPDRLYSAPLHPGRERWANGLGAWDALLRDTPLQGNGTSLVVRCSDYLNETLGLGYTLRHEDRIQLPAEGTLFSQLRLLAAQFEDTEGNDLRRIVTQIEGLERVPVVQLHDEKNDIDVTPMDIGVGVSQTLPVVVGAVDPDCTIFAVEQPELHIHPAVQVNLADIFLREILDEKKKPRLCLLETHSEHLILRVMKRMRQSCDGELPAGFPLVKPDDVSVLYVEVTDGTTRIREMPLNERGELVKAWPGGFFEEGLRETL